MSNTKQTSKTKPTKTTPKTPSMPIANKANVKKPTKKADPKSKRSATMSKSTRTPKQVSIDKKKANNTSFKPGNNAGANSTKYNSKYCQDIVSYFSRDPIQVLYQEFYDNKGNLTSKKPIPFPCDYPTFELYAAKLGVVTNTLLNWCKEYPEFADSYAQAKELQRALLTINAIRGLYNPLYAKFEAVNNHALKDKTEVNNTITTISDEDRKLLEKVSKRVGGDNGAK